MATPRIAPDIRTQRKFVRAWVRLERQQQPITDGQLQALDRVLVGLAHWYDDEAVDWDCSCDACSWWRAEVHRHRGARE